jgi:uncharacterized protein (TIGR02145 family)
MNKAILKLVPVLALSMSMLGLLGCEDNITYPPEVEIRDTFAMFENWCDHYPCGKVVVYDSVSDNEIEYKFTNINGINWMSENLRTTPADTNLYKSWCRPDDPDCLRYGRYYSWRAAAKMDTKWLPEGLNRLQGICPKDWRVPSNDDWMSLEKYLGINALELNNSGWRGTDEGQRLKSSRDWNGLGWYAFDAIPTGFYNIDKGVFINEPIALWWSSTVLGDNDGFEPQFRGISENNSQIMADNFEGNIRALAVRCVQ